MRGLSMKDTMPANIRKLLIAAAMISAAPSLSPT
jgi:hypothetical protein